MLIPLMNLCDRYLNLIDFREVSKICSLNFDRTAKLIFRLFFVHYKRIMELFRTFPKIRRIELEIQTLNDEEQPSMFRLESIINHFFLSLVYENNPQRYAEMIKDKILDLLEQAFPNPMFVNDLAKYCFSQLLTKRMFFLFLLDTSNVIVKQCFKTSWN